MSDAPEIITVDVKGAVKQPGVYELRPIAESMMLFIRQAGWQQMPIANRSTWRKNSPMKQWSMLLKKGGMFRTWKFRKSCNFVSASRKTGKVRLNRATESELQTVSGIGQKRAQDIIAYREANGPFRSVDDLKNVSGIGEKTLEKLRDAFNGGLKTSPFRLSISPLCSYGCILVSINHLGFRSAV